MKPLTEIDKQTFSSFGFSIFRLLGVLNRARPRTKSPGGFIKTMKGEHNEGS